MLLGSANAAMAPATTSATATQRDRARVPERERRDAHFASSRRLARPGRLRSPASVASVIVAPSGRPAWPSTITCSPALTPLSDLDVLAVGEPERHGAALRPCRRRRRTPPSPRLRARSRRRDERRRRWCCSASMSTSPACRPEALVGPAKARRTGPWPCPARPRPGATPPSAATLGVDRPRHAVRRGADARCATTSASGTDATTSRRRGSMTRSTGSRGRGFDEVAGVVEALGDHAVERGAHRRAAGDRLGRRRAPPAPAPARPAASASSRSASSTSLRAATPRSNRSRRARLRGRGVVERASARATSACWRCTSAAERRNLEAHQQVAAPDAIAFGLRDLGDPRRLRRDDDQLGAGRRRHDAGGVDDARGSSPSGAAAVVTGTTVSLVDLLGAPGAAAASERSASASSDGDSERRAVVVMAAALRSRARDRRAPSGNARRASSERSRDVARGLQRLQQRGDAGLSEPIRVLRQLLDLLRLRQDLVAIAHDRPGAARRRSPRPP